LVVDIGLAELVAEAVDTELEVENTGLVVAGVVDNFVVDIGVENTTADSSVVVENIHMIELRNFDLRMIHHMMADCMKIHIRLTRKS